MARSNIRFVVASVAGKRGVIDLDRGQFANFSTWEICEFARDQMEAGDEIIMRSAMWRELELGTLQLQPKGAA